MAKPFKLSQHIHRSSFNVKDFGAVGDQVADDSDAIQAAITAAAGQFGEEVYFPAGDYYITRPIMIPNYTRIRGDGPAKSRINLQGKPYSSHIFEMSDAATAGWLHISDFAFRGGSYGIYNPTPSQESWTLENVAFEIQSLAGIGTNSFQVNTLSNCVFYYCATGVRLFGGFCNHNKFISCDFAGLSQQALLALGASCEVNDFIGCRFEGGGIAAIDATFELNTSNNLNILGCYIEATHPRFLNHLGAGGGTVIDQCHFTYPVSAGGYEFNSAALVTFGTNTWGRKSAGAAKMLIVGDNGGMLGGTTESHLVRSRDVQDFVTKPWALVTGNNTIDVIGFAREFVSNTPDDMSTLSGEVTVIVDQSTTGGFSSLRIATFPVNLHVMGGGALYSKVGTVTTVDDTTAGTVTITPTVSGLNLRLAINGVAASLTQARARIAWRSFSVTASGFNPIIATPL